MLYTLLKLLLCHIVCVYLLKRQNVNRRLNFWALANNLKIDGMVQRWS